MYEEKEKLNTHNFYQQKRWLNVADYIRRKYNYTCQDCGRHGTHIHHINPLTAEDYINRPTNKCYGEDNLICLCHYCHEQRHTQGKVRKGCYIDKNGQIHQC